MQRGKTWAWWSLAWAVLGGAVALGGDASPPWWMVPSSGIAHLPANQEAPRQASAGMPQGPPEVMQGVDSACTPPCGELRWNAWGPIPWQAMGQGEYVGPPRPPHVREYRLRVDDEIEFVFRLRREELAHSYQLEVGDVIRIESLVDPALNRDVTIQPDGTVDLLLLGSVRVVRRTVTQVRDDLQQRYRQFYRVPDVHVTRVKTQTQADDLLQAVNNRFFSGGQGKRVRVTPEGTISLPAIGVVPAQGLTLQEVGREVEERYRLVAAGLEVTPILAARAPRYIYVVGEVRNPGRFELTAPTTVMQAIALAGGWVNGGNLRQVVVFRRAEDWRLLATRLDIRGALYGERPAPADEIWLRDSDVVVVPKMPVRRADDLIELYLTRGVYSAFPIFFNYSLNSSSTITPLP
jgi:polysaccharide export outer membrane protein